ncbi:MAG: PDZ domain-containing protein [Planctomycetes bacterium]|nr:PDZ domain-containing protein [Planctomycetota bacterium]
MTLLGEYADAQGLLLFPNALPWNMTVVLPTVDDYRKSMPLSRAVGRYENATRTLESISVSDVLFHEFTHGLHHGDQVAAGQRHAPWVVEGLASLFQRCTVRKGRIEVQPGSDLVALQDAVRDKKVHPLTELAAMDHKTFMEDAATCYMQARYVMFQLYREGKLRAFYETYKADYVADPTGMKSLAKTLGKPIKDVDADWRRWVLAQEPPWTPARPPKAHLGVRMGPADGGVRVTGFAPGSAAERAGVLKVNDVIISVAGQATPASRDIVFAVQLCQPGQTVDIEVIRDGRAMTVRQLLGHMME